MTHKDSNFSSLPSWFAIAHNNIIRNIELKVAFKPSFIESENFNVILFKKERYFHFLISAAANNWAKLSEEVLKEEAISKRYSYLEIVSLFLHSSCQMVAGAKIFSSYPPKYSCNDFDKLVDVDNYICFECFDFFFSGSPTHCLCIG